MSTGSDQYTEKSNESNTNSSDSQQEQFDSVLIDQPLPVWLVNPVIPRLKQLGIFTSTPHRGPNHVLVNEYEPGQGIMPHEDGEAYAPIVATVSLGGTTI